MICKNCGKEINDNSKFCNFCGERLEDKEIKFENLETSGVQPPKRRRGKFFIIFAIFAVVLTTFTVFSLMSMSLKIGGSGIVGDLSFERELYESDFSIETTENTFSYVILITPKRNIKSCTVTFNLYDYKSNPIYTKSLTKTNMKKGIDYTYLFDYDFLESLTSTKYSYSVRGTVISLN